MIFLLERNILIVVSKTFDSEVIYLIYLKTLYNNQTLKINLYYVSLNNIK